MQPGDDQPRDMRNVANQQRLDLGGDLRKAPEIDCPRIAARSGDDHARAKFASQPSCAVVIDGLGVIDPKATHRIVHTGHAAGITVAVMPTGRHVETHDPVARPQQGAQHGNVRDRRRERLDVSVLGTEDGLGARDCEPFDGIHRLAAVKGTARRVAAGIRVD